MAEGDVWRSVSYAGQEGDTREIKLGSEEEVGV